MSEFIVLLLIYYVVVIALTVEYSDKRQFHLDLLIPFRGVVRCVKHFIKYVIESYQELN